MSRRDFVDTNGERSRRTIMVNCQASVGAATSADAVRLADASARDDKRQPVLVEDDQKVPALALVSC